MNRILFHFVSLFILISITFAFAEVQPLTLSPVFSGISATPRIARNESDSLWVVAWRQGSPGKILARTVQINGKTGARKTLATGVTSARHSFDIAYDSVSNRYVLVFETSRGLQAQIFASNLGKQGTASVLEAGVKESRARIVFNSSLNQYLVFWLSPQSGTNGNALKVLILNNEAKPVGQTRVVADADSASSFKELNIARNFKTGNLMALILEINQSGESVIGYTIKPEGNLLSQQPLQFQSSTAPLNTIPQASFDRIGKGVVFWNDRNFVKFRKVSAKGTFASAQKSISNTGNVDSFQVGTAFNSNQNRFLTIWSEEKTLKSAELNSKTVSVITAPSSFAESSLTFARHAEVSYSPQENAFLAVWEDALAINGGKDSKFKIRAAILGSSSGPETTVTISNIRFEPESITVKAGSTVRWQNNSKMTHTVTNGTGGANSGNLFDHTLDPGKSFSFKFVEPGTYDYFCRIHVAFGMKAVVIVTP